MKAVIVKLSTIMKHGWSPHTYLGDTSEQDQAVQRAKRTIVASKSRIKNANKEKAKILDKQKALIEGGEIKPL